jgi:hypothetical protein
MTYYCKICGEEIKNGSIRNNNYNLLVCNKENHRYSILFTNQKINSEGFQLFKINKLYSVHINYLNNKTILNGSSEKKELFNKIFDFIINISAKSEKEFVYKIEKMIVLV